MMRTLQVINSYGDKLNVEILKEDERGMETIVGYWDYQICYCCFNNKTYRTNLDCLGSCSIGDYVK